MLGMPSEEEEQRKEFKAGSCHWIKGAVRLSAERRVVAYPNILIHFGWNGQVDHVELEKTKHFVICVL